LRLAAGVAAFVFAAACGGSSTFSFGETSVDASYSCPPNSRSAAYDVHATVSAHNGTSKAVTITSVGAVMTVSAVQGVWLQKVGDRYDAGNVTFTPSSVPAGSTTTLQVTIPSACSSGKAPTGANYGEYEVSFKVITSAGTYEIKSGNRHRILA
jgi:hypothetical protein